MKTNTIIQILCLFASLALMLFLIRSLIMKYRAERHLARILIKEKETQKFIKAFIESTDSGKHISEDQLIQFKKRIRKVATEKLSKNEEKIILDSLNEPSSSGQTRYVNRLLKQTYML